MLVLIRKRREVQSVLSALQVAAIIQKCGEYKLRIQNLGSLAINSEKRLKDEKKI